MPCGAEAAHLLVASPVWHAGVVLHLESKQLKCNGAIRKMQANLPWPTSPLVNWGRQVCCGAQKEALNLHSAFDLQKVGRHWLGLWSLPVGGSAGMVCASGPEPS